MANFVSNTVALYTEAQRTEVWQQLERLKRNSHFSHSRRFPSFLSFIIREELEGRGEQLKERTVGVEVFGRNPGYDTTADPIVRVTAAEIRKRIAQYYQEPGHAAELRIALQPGSYVPHFEFAREEPVGALQAALRVTQPELQPPVEPLRAAAVIPGSDSVPPRPRRTGWVAGLAVLLVLLVGAGWWMLRPREDAVDLFWAPVLASKDPVVICFPSNHLETVRLRAAGAPEQVQSFAEQPKALILDDLQPIVSVAELLSAHHRPYSLTDDSANLTDLRHGPTVYLGAFDNSWTLRMTEGLRFRFGNDRDMKHFWIEDTRNPKVHWQIDRHLQLATESYRDYAIVARFADPSTGQLAVVAAGIAQGGTIAAGEFLTRPDGTLARVKEHAPPGWAGRNMEFVLGTEVIDGRSGPPKVEAMFFW